ncbi:MAG: hypothetical protein ACHP9Y_05240 [Gammaproteobacteria bacterium]
MKKLVTTSLMLLGFISTSSFGFSVMSQHNTSSLVLNEIWLCNGGIENDCGQGNNGMLAITKITILKASEGSEYYYPIVISPLAYNPTSGKYENFDYVRFIYNGNKYIVNNRGCQIQYYSNELDFTEECQARITPA